MKACIEKIAYSVQRIAYRMILFPLYALRSTLYAQKGFTLIEGVLSVLIIGVGLIGVLYVFSGSTKSSLQADQVAVAQNLAEEKLETIIADKANSNYTTVINNINSGSYNDGPIFSIYNRTATRSYINVPANPDANATDDFSSVSGSDTGYALVNVTVTFNNGNDSVVVKTLLSNW